MAEVTTRATTILRSTSTASPMTLGQCRGTVRHELYSMSWATGDSGSKLDRGVRVRKDIYIVLYNVIIHIYIYTCIHICRDSFPNNSVLREWSIFWWVCTAFFSYMWLHFHKRCRHLPKPWFRTQNSHAWVGMYICIIYTHTCILYIYTDRWL
jgi:hypothetical protein